jgi:hypothetical protein
VKFSHPRDISHPYLPLATLQQDILEGTEGGNKVRVERTLMPKKHRTFTIGDQEVDTLVMEDRVFLDGQLEEVALDYFAQDDDGNVYYFGEDVDEYENGKIKNHEGSWLLGKDTPIPGVVLPTHPKVGDKFKLEDVSKDIAEDDEVVSVHETVVVPAGTFRDCIKIKEHLADGTTEYKYYAKGVGAVRETPSDGDELLIAHKTTAMATESPKPAAPSKADARERRGDAGGSTSGPTAAQVAQWVAAYKAAHPGHGGKDWDVNRKSAAEVAADPNVKRLLDLCGPDQRPVIPALAWEYGGKDHPWINPNASAVVYCVYIPVKPNSEHWKYDKATNRVTADVYVKFPDQNPGKDKVGATQVMSCLGDPSNIEILVDTASLNDGKAVGLSLDEASTDLYLLLPDGSRVFMYHGK